MSFFNKMPAESKNNKSLIFAEKYDEVFSDDITADSIILVISLFNEIEKRKQKQKFILNKSIKNYEDESFILHATYYILYVLNQLAERDGINKTWSNYKKIISKYDEAIKLVKTVVLKEKKKKKSLGEDYTHRRFFISNSPKTYINNLLK